MGLPIFGARALCTIAAPGSSAFVVNTAVTGYQAPSGVLSNTDVTYYYAEGVDANGVPTGLWEEGYGTYTSAGTSLARTTIINNSSGNTSAINFTGTTRVGLAPNARFETQLQTALQTYICGLLVTQSTTTAIAVSAGSCWDPSSNKLITYAGGTNSPSLAASKVYAVYLYDNAGTPTLDVQQEDPPSTAYAGTARKRGSGNGGRYIGYFLTDASSHVYSIDTKELGAGLVGVTYNASLGAAPFRVLNGGTSTTYASVTNLATVVPKYVCTDFRAITWYTETGVTGELDVSLDGTNSVGLLSNQVSLQFMAVPLVWPIIAASATVLYKVSGTSPSAYFDVIGFTMAR